MQLVHDLEFCFSVAVKNIKLVTMPLDSLPRRIDWGQWIDGLSMTESFAYAKSPPRFWFTPEDTDSREQKPANVFQTLNRLENVDPFAIFTNGQESVRHLFAGAWDVSLPSWALSVQTIFEAQFEHQKQSYLKYQTAYWSEKSNLFQTDGFLVTDASGRLFSLSSIASTWWKRQSLKPLALNNELPWFAGIIDLPGHSQPTVRFSRLGVVESRDWCGGPNISEKMLECVKIFLKNHQQLWLSTPSWGVDLWFLDQCSRNGFHTENVVTLGSILGWHPIRDALAFLQGAPFDSVLLLVDRQAKFHFLKKERPVGERNGS